MSTFGQILLSAKVTLSTNQDLVAKAVIQAEAERIVIAAYERMSGFILPRFDLFSRAKEEAPVGLAAEVESLAGKRAAGRPLQYVLGRQTFLDHEYEVSDAVLIPRPETEVLVSEALTVLSGLSMEKPLVGFEIGLGSGAISIELLARFSCLTMHASEVSGAAIDMARKNADRILLDNSSRLYVHRSESPLAVWESFDAAAPRADFVISNPPYLSEYDQIDHEVLLHEPKAALFPAGDDVLYFYREIAAGGALNIRAGGFAFVEVPHERAHDIERLFVRHGWRVRLVNDLTGRPRVLVALLGGNEDK